MKINPEHILLNKKNLTDKNKIFLINGNEETLVFAIEKHLINIFKKKNFLEIIKTEGGNIDQNSEILFKKPSLFHDSKIVVFKNPKNVDFDYLSEIDDNSVLIITHTKLKSTSKIKQQFEKDSNFCSIACYEITRGLKKNLISNYFNLNKIKIDNDAFWFLLDFSSSLYGVFISEINKLIDYGKNNLSLSEIKKLLSENSGNDDFDSLFFLLVSDNSSIIKKTHREIKNLNDAYSLVQRAKYYILMLSQAQNKKDAEREFPKYLFRYKDIYLRFFDSINKKKILNVLFLIKKTELMLRKHSDFYFIITQRFLLNLKKNLR